jgi:hypothetical protein
MLTKPIVNSEIKVTILNIVEVLYKNDITRIRYANIQYR